MNVKVSYKDLETGKFPEYESGDTIIIIGGGYFGDLTTKSKFKSLLKFDKPYHLVIENEANNESLFDSNILSFTSSDLEELPDYVFINCSELEKIEMPSLIIIGTCAFTNCKK